MDGWLGSLNKAVYPRTSEYRNSRPAPGCPTFGETTVLERPFSLSQPEPSVKPGLHSPQEGQHQVVWWDPAKLRLRVDAKLGLRTFELLQGEPGPSSEPYRLWRERRRQAVEAGSKPEYTILIPSGLTEEPNAEITIEVISNDVSAARPSGLRFGALVHAVVRDAGFDDTAIDRLAKLHARILGASSEETTAASEAVRAALRSRLLQRARSAVRCQRELTVRLRLDDNRIRRRRY